MWGHALGYPAEPTRAGILTRRNDLPYSGFSKRVHHLNGY